jgi:hypothetical protein
MDILSEFINKIFNNLNWAITEFGVAAKDVSTTFKPIQTNFFEVSNSRSKI